MSKKADPSSLSITATIIKKSKASSLSSIILMRPLAFGAFLRRRDELMLVRALLAIGLVGLAVRLAVWCISLTTVTLSLEGTVV
jgi:hypothetical protein